MLGEALKAVSLMSDLLEASRLSKIWLSVIEMP